MKNIICSACVMILMSCAPLEVYSMENATNIGKEAEIWRFKSSDLFGSDNIEYHSDGKRLYLTAPAPDSSSGFSSYSAASDFDNCGVDLWGVEVLSRHSDHPSAQAKYYQDEKHIYRTNHDGTWRYNGSKWDLLPPPQRKLRPSLSPPPSWTSAPQRQSGLDSDDSTQPVPPAPFPKEIQIRTDNNLTFPAKVISINNIEGTEYAIIKYTIDGYFSTEQAKHIASLVKKEGGSWVKISSLGEGNCRSDIAELGEKNRLRPRFGGGSHRDESSIFTDNKGNIYVSLLGRLKSLNKTTNILTDVRIRGGLEADFEFIDADNNLYVSFWFGDSRCFGKLIPLSAPPSGRGSSGNNSSSSSSADEGGNMWKQSPLYSRHFADDGSN